jgi:anti-sigma-K factor RskA
VTVHEQAAAFVLDALDAEEAEEFERHISMCPDCEDDLEPLRVAAAALAFAGELPPPPAALRRRVLAVDAVVLRFSRRWQAPLASAAALAACVALVLALTGNEPHRHSVSLNLPAAPAGKVYEIWFVRHGHAVPAGFAHAGRTDVAHVPRGAAVAVTLEPRGGSGRPTGPLLLRTETA